MKRLIIVYNPRSSRFANVQEEVLLPAQKLRGYMIGKYEVRPTNLNDNISKLARIIKDGDIVLSAGGDATGIITSNALLKSGRAARFAALPYGNFNDLARTLGCANLEAVLAKDAREVDFYPLEVAVDGKVFRFATCYVTIGMTAEAVGLYDSPTMRKKLHSKFGRKITSYTALVGWYFKNRRGKQFIPDFSLNGTRQKSDTSDYAALNGSFMARVMKGGDDYQDPRAFRSVTGRLTNLIRLTDLMVKSILRRVPGAETIGDVLQFDSPATVSIQTEGESQVFENVRKITIRKANKCFKAIQNSSK